MIVTCSRCLAEHAEDSPDVVYTAGDWWCADENACGGRLITLLLGRDDAI